jgi:hypothetical protein
LDLFRGQLGATDLVGLAPSPGGRRLSYGVFGLRRLWLRLFGETSHLLERLTQPGVDANDETAGGRAALVGKDQVFQIGREPHQMQSDHCLPDRMIVVPSKTEG